MVLNEVCLTVRLKALHYVASYSSSIFQMESDPDWNHNELIIFSFIACPQVWHFVDSIFVHLGVNIDWIANQPCLIYCQQYSSTPWGSTSSTGPHYGEWRTGKITSIEVTFRNTTNQRFDKWRAESRRQPAPSAGDWPRQPTGASPQVRGTYYLCTRQR